MDGTFKMGSAVLLILPSGKIEAKNFHPNHHYKSRLKAVERTN